VPGAHAGACAEARPANNTTAAAQIAAAIETDRDW